LRLATSESLQGSNQQYRGLGENLAVWSGWK
jgi:hypothetical protein